MKKVFNYKPLPNYHQSITIKLKRVQQTNSVIFHCLKMNIYYLHIIHETRRGWSSPPLSIRMKIVTGCKTGNVHLYSLRIKLSCLNTHYFFVLLLRVGDVNVLLDINELENGNTRCYLFGLIIYRLSEVCSIKSDNKSII